MTAATVALFICLTITGAIALLVNVHHIHAWERANNYPYGKLCDVFHNCR